MRILYCHCAYARVVPPEVKQEVLRALAEGDADFDAVPDLCEMSARRDPALKQIADGGDVAIVACYPRAVKWLFHAAAAPLPDGVRVFNMRVEPAADIVRDLGAAVGTELASAPPGGDELRLYDSRQGVDPT